MSYFTDAEIKDLPEDPYLALDYVIEKFYNDESIGSEHKEEYYETHSLVIYIIEKNALPINIKRDAHKAGNWADMINQNLREVVSIIQVYTSDNAIEKNMARFDNLIGDGFQYEFTDGDYSEIHRLIDLLRNEIDISEELDDRHKKRLIKRIDELKADLSKSITNLDSFWGLLVEAKVLYDRHGKKVIGVVTIVKQIMKIVWNTQSHSEGLPSGTNFALPEIEEEETEEDEEE